MFVAILSGATKKPVPDAFSLSINTTESLIFSDVKSTAGATGFSETICCGARAQERKRPNANKTNKDLLFCLMNGYL